MKNRRSIDSTIQVFGPCVRYKWNRLAERLKPADSFTMIGRLVPSALLLSMLALLGVPIFSANAETEKVDLALVLAVDCSFSVDTSEYRMQMDGVGLALQDPGVLEAIQGGPAQKIALLVVLWSDEENQRVVLPWTIVASESDARQTGAKLARQPRVLAEGGTATAAALIFALQQFADAPPSLRMVIDLSTDGASNMGSAVDKARDSAVKIGITINGLAVTNEVDTLVKYLTDNVIGGTGSFVEKANSFQDFGAVMKRKLIREILGQRVT
jgi:hypothetical protein